MAKLSAEDSQPLSNWSVGDLGDLYSESLTEFVGYARRTLKDPVQAEEVVQEAFIKVMLAAPELESKTHARAYLRAAIDNLCVDIFRREGRRPRLIVLDEAAKEIERYSSLDGDLSSVIASAEDASIIRKALAMLSPAERAALLMWEMEKISTKEISRHLGIKESSVRHTVSRARTSLRRILSELIVDEARGLTALDLLSVSIKKVTTVSRKNSKLALSFLFLVFAIQGFSSRPFFDWSPESRIEGRYIEANAPVVKSEKETTEFVGNQSNISTIYSKQNADASPKSEEKELFPGLNRVGIPKGFTIADSKGFLGDAYFRERTRQFAREGEVAGHIIKTESRAANIFITQSLSVVRGALTYEPVVAFGRDGIWVPLQVEVLDSRLERISSGNYLFTVDIQVQSEVETALRIVASAGGRDLATAPSRIVARILLTPAKNEVLAQAVYVIEEEMGA